MKTKLQLYQLVAPLVQLGIWEDNFRTGEFYCNDIIKGILGLGFEDIITQSEISRFYKNPELVDAMIRRALINPAPQEIELELTNLKEQDLVIKMVMKASVDEQGCYGIYGTMQDVTETVRKREERNQLQQLFTNAFIHAPIGIALVSLTGRWMKTNHSLRQLLGYSEEEMVSKGFQDITHPEDLESSVEALDHLINDLSGTYTTEKRYYHRSGRIIWVMLSVVVIRDDFQRPLYFVSHVKDISDRKATMETIKRQNERLIDFAYIVSHNLRSHASNMQMLTKLILEEEQESEKVKSLDMLHTNSINLLNTLSNLNEVVKINDNLASQKKRLNVREEVDRVLQILSAELNEFNVLIECLVSENLWINFNSAYLESVLLNLISNCIKYRDECRRLSITIQATENHEMVEIIVSDNGVGIDLSLHGDQLFGLYKTFHGNSDAQGLGLFITKSQIETMGGRIRVHSEPHKGSRFTVEVPTH